MLNTLKCQPFIRAFLRALSLSALGVLAPATASAELLAMLNYESKVGQPNRREGIAVIDVDPNSPRSTRSSRTRPCPRISWRITSTTTKM